MNFENTNTSIDIVILVSSDIKLNRGRNCSLPRDVP